MGEGKPLTCGLLNEHVVNISQFRTDSHHCLTGMAVVL
jgi:hypothetical protein